MADVLLVFGRGDVGIALDAGWHGGRLLVDPVPIRGNFWIRLGPSAPDGRHGHGLVVHGVQATVLLGSMSFEGVLARKASLAPAALVGLDRIVHLVVPREIVIPRESGVACIWEQQNGMERSRLELAF